MAVKTLLFLVKKTKNYQKVPVKNESGREKGKNLAKKWSLKTVFAREKIEKKPKKAFHGHFSFSREKKNTSGFKFSGA